MNFLQGVATEFRARRLWALAAVLLVALIAVPIVLSKSYPPPTGPIVTPGTPQAPSVPALSLKNGAVSVPVRGSARDPFTPQPGSVTSSSTSTTTSTTISGAGASSTTPASTTSTTTTTTSSGGTGSGTGTGSGSTSTGGTSAGGTSTGVTPPPVVSDLTSTQAYRVALSITTPGGGLNTLDPLKRLSILPRDSQPLLVALGVLRGGGRVVFAVEPGTAVSGPGRCIPGPLDCEVLTLAANQIESVSRQGDTGAPLASFAVTAISRRNFPTSAAAMAVRTRVYRPGRQLLRKTNLHALLLFRYEPSRGVVVDLRNLNQGFTG